MNANMADEANVKTPKKRNVSELPKEIVDLVDSHENWSKFVTALELDENERSKTHGKEFLVVQSIRLNVDEKTTFFELKKVRCAHLRKLCCNMGLQNCGSLNKFECRRRLAGQIQYEHALDTHGMKPTSNASQITSTICRAVNVVFSDEFITGLLSVNDRKGRREHETNDMYLSFWQRATDAHNITSICLDVDETVVEVVCTNDTRSSISARKPAASDLLDDSTSEDESQNRDADTVPTNDVFATLVIPVGDEYLCSLQADPEINLQRNIILYEMKAFRTKILNLFKIRRDMKANMTVSGTHDSDPWNFIEASMKKVPGYTKISVYYFYKRCEEMGNGVDAHFSPFLDSDLIGDSGSLESLDDSYSAPSQRKRKSPDSEFLSQIAQQGEAMLQLMTASEKLLQESEKDRRQEAMDRRQEAMDRRQEAKDRANAVAAAAKDRANAVAAAVAEQRKSKSFERRLALAQALNDTDALRKLQAEANDNVDEL
jgi:hypothetical protein